MNGRDRNSGFHIATEDQIRSGEVTDVYFRRTLEILEARGLNPTVRAEFVVKSMRKSWEGWGILAGLDEALELLADLDITVRAMPEGTLFREFEPVLELEGPYRNMCVYETALLGFLCQATGVATSAARCRHAAGDRLLLSFGARRLHPAVTPAVERAAYLGGCDGVATVTGARAAGIEPSGTIPHALVLVMGDTLDAMWAFHACIDPDVPRVCLIDTFQDEKFEAIRMAEQMGSLLDALRLDTPGTRKGDFLQIFQEVRWELDSRGHEDLKLFASGGIGEDEIRRLNEVVDGYGVGGAISAAPIADFALDNVEVGGRPVAKRGKWSGGKRVLLCRSCGVRRIAPLQVPIPECECGGEMDDLLLPRGFGPDVRKAREPADRIRERVLEQLAELH